MTSVIHMHAHQSCTQLCYLARMFGTHLLLYLRDKWRGVQTSALQFGLLVHDVVTPVGAHTHTHVRARAEAHTHTSAPAAATLPAACAQHTGLSYFSELTREVLQHVGVTWAHCTYTHNMSDVHSDTQHISMHTGYAARCMCLARISFCIRETKGEACPGPCRRLTH